MKRILLSILASFVFIGSLFTLLFILEEGFGVSEEKTYYLTFPVRIPSFIYFNILNLQEPTTELAAVPIIIAALLFNVILYSSIFYLVLTLLARFRRKPKIEGIENPPEPPIFN